MHFYFNFFFSFTKKNSSDEKKKYHFVTISILDFLVTSNIFSSHTFFLFSVFFPPFFFLMKFRGAGGFYTKNFVDANIKLKQKKVQIKIFQKKKKSFSLLYSACCYYDPFRVFQYVYLSQNKKKKVLNFLLAVAATA